MPPESAPRRWLAILVAVASLIALPTSAADPGPRTPDQERETFELEPGLTIDWVAAEPLVRSPSAIAWDASGRCFVAENPGYPVGPGPGQPPVGALLELIDTDDDGRFDRRVVFADGLAFPNGLLPWRGGWLVTDAPNVYWMADGDGDGRADRREVWWTGFATNQTTQLRVCYPTVGPDGWIYLSRGWSGGVIHSPKWPHLPPVDLKDGDFRFRPDGSAAEAIGGNAQFGLVLDDVGRRFLVSNRNPLMHAVVHPRWWRRHPALPFGDLVQDVSPTGYEAKVYPRSPDTTTSGFMPDLMAAPHAGTFTSACGIEQIFGEALGAEFQGSWLICEPAQSLVQRQVVEPVGPTFAGRRAIDGREFLSSSDGWFRPVFAATGPDGAVYVVDMYRKIIDHPDYLPEEARRRLDFDSGKDLGRIWRVADASGTRRIPAGNLARTSVSEWVEALGATNRWVRQTAHRLLLEHPGTNTLAALIESTRRTLHSSVDESTFRTNGWSHLVRRTADPASGPHWGQARRLHLIGTYLESNRDRAIASHDPLVVGHHTLLLSTFDPSPTVREAAWRVAQRLVRERKHALPDVGYDLVYWWADDPSPAVRFQFALLCGEQDDWTPVVPALVRIARRDAADRWTRAAVLSGLHRREADFVRALFTPPVEDSPAFASLAGDLGRMLAAEPSPEAAGYLVRVLQPSADGTAWQAAALHGLARGLRTRGTNNLSTLARSVPANLPESAETPTRLERAARTARRIAADSSAPPAARLAAIELLGEFDYPTAGEVLAARIASGESPEIQLAAVRALGHFDEPAVGRLLVDPARWNLLGPPAREAALAALTSRPSLVPPLLDALEKGALPRWTLNPQRRRQLEQHRDAAIRDRARALFADLGGSDRLRVFQELRPVLDLAGSGQRGREVFARVCANCHQLGGLGVNVGPDLTGVKNQPAEALLLHLLVPDAEVYPGFQAYEIETRDGRSLTGLLIADTGQAITLRQAGGGEETLPRSAIASLTQSRVSLMPAELERTMTRQELADLLAFVRGLP